MSDLFKFALFMGLGLLMGGGIWELMNRAFSSPPAERYLAVERDKMRRQLAMPFLKVGAVLAAVGAVGCAVMWLTDPGWRLFENAKAGALRAPARHNRPL